jgi:ABC-2 type transport system permease protein
VRDVDRLMRLALRVLFYGAPVIYPLAKVRNSTMPQWVKDAYEANPLVGIFQLHHAAWYPGEFPSASLLTITIAGCVMVLLCGLWVFRSLEPAVLKEL